MNLCTFCPSSRVMPSLCPPLLRGEKQILCCLTHDVDAFSLDLEGRGSLLNCWRDGPVEGRNYYPQILSYRPLVTPAARSELRWQQVRNRYAGCCLIAWCWHVLIRSGRYYYPQILSYCPLVTPTARSKPRWQHRWETDTLLSNARCWRVLIRSGLLPPNLILYSVGHTCCSLKSPLATGENQMHCCLTHDVDVFPLDLEGTTTPKSYLIARWSHLPLAQIPVGNHTPSTTSSASNRSPPPSIYLIPKLGWSSHQNFVWRPLGRADHNKWPPFLRHPSSLMARVTFLVDWPLSSPSRFSPVRKL